MRPLAAYILIQICINLFLNPNLMEKSAAIALVKNNKVLMQKRDNKIHVIAAGQWGLPGGLVEKGESLKSAVIRECEEETGYKLKDPKFLSSITYKTNGKQKKVYVFYVNYDGKQKIHCFEGQKMAFKSQKDLKRIRVVLNYKKLAEQAIKIVNSKCKKLLLIGSQGNVGQGILQAAKEQGIEVKEFDKKLGDHIERLTLPKLLSISSDVSAIIYCAEVGNRDLYDKDPSLVERNVKTFTHFSKLVDQLDKEIRLYYIGGSWTKRKIPKDFIVKDRTPNKTKADNPNDYELAKIAAEQNASKLTEFLKLDITYFDWISIVPNYSENFTINKFMQELLTTGQIGYTPGKFGRPLLASKDAGKALLLYMKKFPEFKKGQFKKVLIPGIFTAFEEMAKIVLKTAKEFSKESAFKKKAELVKRTDTPPDFLKARVKSRLFASIGFKPSRAELKKALRENAEYAVKRLLLSKKIKPAN